MNTIKNCNIDVTNEIDMVSDSESLYVHCMAAMTHQRVAVDTEFYRTNHHYYPKPSLMQLAYGNKTIIIDLLSTMDFSPLISLLTDETITKIIHAFKQDVEMIYQMWQIKPKNVLDTQIAMMFFGFTNSPGYEKLIKTYIGNDVTISKQLQFSNWLRRPISAAQIQYAAQDVIYLLKVAPIIQHELTVVGKIKWVMEECAAAIADTRYEPNIINITMKIIDFDTVSPQKLALAMRIAKWREQIAQQCDVHRHCIARDSDIEKIINTIMFEILNSQEGHKKSQIQIIIKEKIKKLQNIQNIHRRTNVRCKIDVNNYINDIIDVAMEIGNNNTEQHDINNARSIIERHKHKRSVIKTDTPVYLAVKHARNIAAKQYNISPTLIATERDIALLAAKIHHDIDKFFCKEQWRYKVFGKNCFDLLNN